MGPSTPAPLEKHWNSRAKRARPRNDFRPAVSGYDARQVRRAPRETAERDLGRVAPEIVFRGFARRAEDFPRIVTTYSTAGRK